MRSLLTVFFTLSGLWSATCVMAEEPARLALVIGNSGYTEKVGPLRNPRNDIALIGAALRRLGFKVTALEDADYRAMDTAIKRYVAEVRDAGKGAISFFYYSGHGVANPETQINYLIPIDVADPEDSNLWYQSFQQSDVIDRLSKQAPNATHYVVFDACRNELNLSGPAAKALGAEKGFVPVQQTAGLLIAYATAPNKTASDVGEDGGPYARALAEELVRPGVEAVTMFRNVQVKVKESIGQDPWLTFPSLPPIYLAGRAAEPFLIATHSMGLSGMDVAQLCQSLANNPSVAVVQSLMETYKGTPIAACAQARLNELIGSQVAAVVPPVIPRAPAVSSGPCISAPITVSLSSRSPQPLSATEECALKPKDVFKECDNCPEMVVVPPGSFTMGSPSNEKGRFDNEGPQHTVTISRAFAVGKFTVTIDQFADFVKEAGYDAGSKCWTFEDRSFRNPGFPQTGAHPAVCLNWDDARAYVAWLSKKTGKPYRLLTEAEWEYAARARTEPGSYPSYFFGDNENDMCRYGNGADQTAKSEIAGAKDWTTFMNCSDGYAYTAPVGSFRANAFGLFDVHGNAWQWLEDCWHENYQNAPTDGSAWISGDCSRRVLRGGSWSSNPRYLRAAIRYRYTSDFRSLDSGFRLGRTITP
jgi:formylglycine-generating enzyme required for sulfatase activity